MSNTKGFGFSNGPFIRSADVSTRRQSRITLGPATYECHIQQTGFKTPRIAHRFVAGGYPVRSLLQARLASLCSFLQQHSQTFTMKLLGFRIPNFTKAIDSLVKNRELLL